MTDTPASLDALGIKPVASMCDGYAETPLYSAEDLAPLIAKARRVEALEAAVRKARDTFDHYGQLHAAKPDPAKAERNFALANEMRAALKENTDDRMATD